MSAPAAPAAGQKRYAPCEHVLELFPAVQLCGRPARIASGEPLRCELHPVKRIWP
ncbi:MAG: hypothetical protein KGL04_10195 [Elusimicrobia bacterium]|nr:hypothetical protein [Elusimicrobiota bacterium]